MARRYPDAWGWWRIVMSPLGPPRTTRFVLCGYMLYLHPQGDGCYVGTRRVAEVTGLNKDTVAEHRDIALRTGWLMLAPAADRVRPGEVWTTVPDDVFPQVGGARRRAGYAQGAVENRSQPPPLSGSFPETVRFGRPECPAPPDRSLRDLKISKSHDDLEEIAPAPVDISQRRRVLPDDIEPEPDVGGTPRRQLLRWLVNDLRAQRTPDDLATLLTRVPRDVRFAGHEEVVQRFVAELGNGSAGGGSTLLHASPIPSSPPHEDDG